jgi:two-component system, response regulator, stage 0 sporulation protein F
VTSPGRLLLVDDEAGVLDVLGDYFGGLGYAVDTAASGEEALRLAAVRRPDLVLLDVRMPGLDGIEVLRRLKRVDGTLPIIMVTANEDVALAREVLRLGAFDYVAKPFDFVYLERAVGTALLRVDTPATDEDASKPPSAGDPCSVLAHAVFRTVRGMAAASRASTGERMERAALALARAGAGGRPGAAEEVTELALLLGIAAELGDLAGPDLAAIESALDRVRRVLRSA